jgi:type II pantothenate kinase
MFLDNAGSDVVLGMIPLARFFAQRGAEVILTANRLPALNDITHRELLPLVQQVGQLDRFWNDALKRGQIRIIESGGVAPLIDLRHVSPVLNTAVSGADFLVLEGMGRSLESNFNARFTVDSMKICLIKDQMVAQRMGGKVFDQVLRYDPALLPTAPQDAPA